MINLIGDCNGVYKKPTGKYQIGLLSDELYEADSMEELTAIVCGQEYLECDFLETQKVMRIEAAKTLGLSTMVQESLEHDDNKEPAETIIVYDEAIGKVPYSYTDEPVDYDIHGNPELIRVECNETFILSLEKIRLIAVWQRDDAGEYNRLSDIMDLDEELVKLAETFKEGQRVPLHKRLGE